MGPFLQTSTQQPATACVAFYVCTEMQPFLSCPESSTFDSASRGITDSERSGRIDSDGHKITLTGAGGFDEPGRRNDRPVTCKAVHP